MPALSGISPQTPPMLCKPMAVILSVWFPKHLSRKHYVSIQLEKTKRKEMEKLIFKKNRK
jgi:hypothetical protein